MNEKINLDLKSLKFILNKNKPYIIPGVTILISIILFFQFVIPQFGSFLTVRKEAKDASLKLETLKVNLDILANTNGEVLNSQFEILSLALPLDKDFIGILNSVYSAAQETGVSLGNFSFKVGDLSKSENGDNFPVVKLSMPINSGVVAVNNFVEAISKTAPLSEVYFVKIGNASSVVNLDFYYKPLDTSNYSQDVRVNPISQKGLILVNQFSELKDAFSSEQLVPAATSSAIQ